MFSLFYIIFEYIVIFREDPPSQTTVSAGQELLRLVESNADGLTYLDPIKEFNIRDIFVAEKAKKVNQIEAAINAYKCIDCPQFPQHVSIKILIFENEYLALRSLNMA